MATQKDNKAAMKLIRAKISRWIVAAGYDSVKAFCRQTKIRLSGETVSRIVEGRGESMPSPFTLFLIMNKLSVSTEEMRTVLMDAGDEDLYKYIGSGITGLLPHEEAMLVAVRKCIGRDASTKEDIAASLKTWGKITGVDLSKELLAFKEK